MKEIRKIDKQTLGTGSRMVNYTDGEVYIIDHVKNLTRISPMQAELNVILLCTKGSIDFDLNSKRTSLNGGEVLLCAPGCIIDNFTIGEGFECKILCLSDRITRELLHGNMSLWESMVYIRQQNIIALPQRDMEQFEYYYWLIRRKMSQSGLPLQRDCLWRILQAMLLDLSSTIRITNATIRLSSKEPISQGKHIFDRFLQLLSHSKVKRQRVESYARHVGASPKYLSVLCTLYSGKTASQWINLYVKEDVLYYIRNTDLSFKEISIQLGFSTVSLFGTYVHRHFGLSPSELRAQAREG